MFLVVGGWNTVFGYAVFVALYALLRHSMNVTGIIAITYVIATLNNFLCYKWFVFRTSGRHVREYLRFTMVYVPAFLANLIVLPIALRAHVLNAYVLQALFTLAVLVTSYFGHKYWTFRRV